MTRFRARSRQKPEKGLNGACRGCQPRESLQMLPVLVSQRSRPNRPERPQGQERSPEERDTCLGVL